MEPNLSIKQRLLSQADEWMTTAEAARAVGVDRRTLQSWIQKGQHPELEYSRSGRLFKFRASSVAKFIEMNTSGARLA